MLQQRWKNNLSFEHEYCNFQASLVGSDCKESACKAVWWVWSLGWEDFLEESLATHSSTLAWRILGQRSLVGYSPWGHKKSDTTEWLSTAQNYNFHGTIEVMKKNHKYQQQFVYQEPDMRQTLVVSGSI